LLADSDVAAREKRAFLPPLKVLLLSRVMSPRIRIVAECITQNFILFLLKGSFSFRHSLGKCLWRFGVGECTVCALITCLSLMIIKLWIFEINVRNIHLPHRGVKRVKTGLDCYVAAETAEIRHQPFFSFMQFLIQTKGTNRTTSSTLHFDERLISSYIFVLDYYLPEFIDKFQVFCPLFNFVSIIPAYHRHPPKDEQNVKIDCNTQSIYVWSSLSNQLPNCSTQDIV
jgi:hypothetical protein